MFGERRRTDKIYTLRSLSAPFSVLKGKLTVAIVTKDNELAGEPLEGWEHIVLQQSGQQTRIDSLAQLKGHVNINSVAGALAFVRLTTSAATWYMFPPNDDPFGGKHSAYGIDIVDKSTIKDVYLYGDKIVLSQFDNGMYGVLNHRACAALGIPSATGKETADGFLIERPIVNFADRFRKGFVATRAVVLQQMISRDGTIKQLDETDLGNSLLGVNVVSAVRWALPKFE